ncbi:hypothetical protein [Shewanella colwelliana]|uniref:hypothetical protein n=1 Tax=Shewanella colwelliana TaxID=23 RepID=UPI0022AF4F95|nr:hypothetical protein [Shewanella colwelliana]MCZ4337741.1 hypothetical protein [Shewanella colwelliana]
MEHFRLKWLLQQLRASAADPISGQISDEALSELVTQINDLDGAINKQATRAFLEFTPLDKLPQHYAKLNDAHIELLLAQPLTRIEPCLVARGQKLTPAEVIKIKSTLSTYELSQLSTGCLENFFTIESEANAGLLSATCYFLDELPSNPGVVIYSSGSDIEVRGITALTSFTPSHQILTGEINGTMVALTASHYLEAPDDLQSLVSSSLIQYLSSNNLQIDYLSSNIELYPAPGRVRKQESDVSNSPDMLF